MDKDVCLLLKKGYLQGRAIMDLTQEIYSEQTLFKMLNCCTSYAGKRKGNRKRKVD